MGSLEIPDEFDDINEAVVAGWEEETTPYERVRTVINHAYTPRTADAVAETAHTSPKTARKHLTTLSEEGFVTTEPGEHGATTYRRSAESLVVEQAAAILEEMSPPDLRDRIGELQDRLADFRDEYDIDSPEALLVDRTNRTLSPDATDPTAPDPDALREWQTTRRNLAFANAALSIATAERFVRDDAGTSGENAAVQ